MEKGDEVYGVLLTGEEMKALSSREVIRITGTEVKGRESELVRIVQKKHDLFYENIKKAFIEALLMSK